MRRFPVLIAAVLLVVFALPAFAGGEPDGAAVFKAKCAMCHGPDGSGQTTMGKTMKLRDLRSAEVQKATDKEWTSLIADGKGKMPAYKEKLQPAEISALVAHMRSIATK